jgi:CheY-like chemotaxis protein
MRQNCVGPGFALVECLRVGSAVCVLVAENEPTVRGLPINIRSEAGFKTLHAEDAAQALDVLENNQSHVDVLFTDLRMRDGMSGLELARVAKLRDPDLRVVITSG